MYQSSPNHPIPSDLSIDPNWLCGNPFSPVGLPRESIVGETSIGETPTGFRDATYARTNTTAGDYSIGHGYAPGITGSGFAFTFTADEYSRNKIGSAPTAASLAVLDATDSDAGDSL